MKSSNLQKKSKLLATHIVKLRLLNTTKPSCKGKSKGLTFPDNLLALFGYRRAKA